MPPKIKKPFVTWEEFNAVMGGGWTPSAHTHPRSEIPDFWEAAFWASIPDKPSTFTPSAHASTHHSGGGDLLDHGSIPGLAGDDHTQYYNSARHTKAIHDSLALDHGALSGKADDDHTQYHTDDRGDARYYTKTLLDGGQLDTRYYTESEVDTKLALQDTLAEMGDTLIVSPEDGEILVWDAESPPSGKWICSLPFPTDHGALSGLGDDDHTQYHNDTRGDARYFRETEFLATTAGVGDEGKPIKLNAAGLVDNTMLVACDADKLDGEHGSHYSVVGHTHDTRYYTESEVDTKLALQDTLAEMGDTLIVSPEDGEILVWDAESPPSGKWICSTQLPSHNHDDRYYTETELNNGQLDNLYFGEDEFLVSSAGPGDSGKPLKLNAAGLIDTTMLGCGGHDYFVKVGVGGTPDYLSVSYFEWTEAGHVMIKKTTKLVDVNADMLDGKHDTDFSLATHGHSLASLSDTLITSPEDGEFLVYDTEANGGKWIASSELPGHTHDDRYYTETELDGGQLDNRYFRENEFIDTSAGVGDSGKPIKLNAAGMVDATMIPGGGQDELVKVGAAGGSDYLNASYFQRDIENHIRIKLNTLLTDIDVDKVDGLHASSFALTTRALDAFGATTDITTLNATTTKHGLLMKLGGGTTNFLRADGTWVAPPSGVTDHGALSGLGDDDHSLYLLASGARALSADWDAGYFEIRSMKFQSDVATGTAPFIINSTTKCINLNADRVDGEHASAIVTKARVDAKACDHGALSGRGDDDHSQYYNATRHTVAVHNALSIDHGSLGGKGDDDHTQYLLASGARALTANWDAGGYQIRSLKFLSDAGVGTAPFIVSSTTKVTNLNADLLDGYHASSSAGNNTIVLRTASGYIYCNYLNCTSGATTSEPTHYFVETGNDSFLRQMTPANFVNKLRADGLMGVIGGGFTGMVTAPDHMGTPATAQVTNVCYGTGSPPPPNTTTIGSLFIRYTA